MISAIVLINAEVDRIPEVAQAINEGLAGTGIEPAGTTERAAG